MEQRNGVPGTILFGLLAFLLFSIGISVVMLIIDPLSTIMPTSVPLTQSSADSIEFFNTIVNMTPIIFSIGICGYIMSASMGADISQNDYVEGIFLILLGITFSAFCVYIIQPIMLYILYIFESVMPLEATQSIMFSDFATYDIVMKLKNIMGFVTIIPIGICYFLFLIKPVKHVFRMDHRHVEYMEEEEVW